MPRIVRIDYCALRHWDPARRRAILVAFLARAELSRLRRMLTAGAAGSGLLSWLCVRGSYLTDVSQRLLCMFSGALALGVLAVAVIEWRWYRLRRAARSEAS